MEFVDLVFNMVSLNGRKNNFTRGLLVENIELKSRRNYPDHQTIWIIIFPN